MHEPTIEDIDALVGPATPHFAFQIRARVREAIEGLPENHPVRAYAEQRIAMLESLGFSSSRAAESDPEPRTRLGWEQLPSSARVDEPLPRNAA